LRELRFFAIFLIDFEYSVNALDAGFAEHAGRGSIEAVFIACVAAELATREEGAEACRFGN
jgi:hypothetical protein